VRRRRALLVTAVVLLLGYTAFSGRRHLTSDSARRPSYAGRLPGNKRGASFQHLAESPAVSWPRSGQAAFVLGHGRATASPDEQPAPIASLTKVMTAYLTLQRYPLNGQEEGFTITVTAGDAEAAAEDAGRSQSTVAVRSGERLTERQLLEALLIPSGNNVARLLADLVAGSESRFLAEMNAEARALGMRHTIYTDPSGFDPATLSTAADQLRVFRQATRFAIFREIVSMASTTLPVAGKLANFNPLIAEGYAGKTGSDSAAGGCLAFFTDVAVDGRRRLAVGVVMGQGEGRNTKDLLAAAGEAARELVDSVAVAPATPAPPPAGP
jgi:D-alanyl-D-alanine carboxypeptidase (penicillin-binding protein 5/6)